MSRPGLDVINAPQRTLVIMSQVYVPDPAAVGQHVADAAEAMAARGWRVVVYASSRGYDDPAISYPSRETLHGVEVHRLPLSSFGKGSLLVRLAAQSLFAIQATSAMIFARRIDVILASTSPPFAGFFGALLSAIRRRPLIWWVMDLNPDQLVLSGTISESSLPARVFDAMNRFTLHRSTYAVALDRFMRDRLLRKADVAAKVRVIPPWPHDHLMQAVSHDRNPFRQRYFPNAQLVVMYSGNHGVSTPVEPLVAAAEMLRDDPRICFAFIGGGVLKASVDKRIKEAQLRNAVTLPYQPLAELSASLSAADIHVVSVGDATVGATHSCKIYNAMLLGKPILAIAPPESHVADIVRSADAGWVIPPGDYLAAAEVLRMAAGLDTSDLEARGRRGQEYVRCNFQRDQLLGGLCELVAGAAC
jgi:colanic acid biosynthesis glycosyl transferase WcaI